MPHGWLSDCPSLGWRVEGVDISPETRTRNVEYHWAADVLRQWTPGTLLDAATGYIPTWHMMPYVAAALGWQVHAVDLDTRTLAMPEHASVTRAVADIGALPYADASFNAVACISTLEHMTPGARDAAAREICRVAAQLILVTADDAPWLPDLFAPYAEVGDAIAFSGNHLGPPVYALTARPR